MAIISLLAGAFVALFHMIKIESSSAASCFCTEGQYFSQPLDINFKEGETNMAIKIFIDQGHNP